MYGLTHSFYHPRGSCQWNSYLQYHGKIEEDIIWGSGWFFTPGYSDPWILTLEHLVPVFKQRVDPYTTSQFWPRHRHHIRNRISPMSLSSHSLGNSCIPQNLLCCNTPGRTQICRPDELCHRIHHSTNNINKFQVTATEIDNAVQSKC